MSFDIKLDKPSDFKQREDQITDVDGITVILNKPIVSPNNVTVRLNDFVRLPDFTTEVIVREDVSAQITGLNNSVINVLQPPIMDGLKIGNLAQDVTDVTVRIKVVEEDVSAQFTGVEDNFTTQGKPILRNSEYDFSYENVSVKDIEVKVNNVVVEAKWITAKSGVVQLKDKPLAGDTVKVTYRFSAAIKKIDSEGGTIFLKEKPIVGQEVKIAYFAKSRDGWTIQKTARSVIPNASDVVFYKIKNTERAQAIDEDVSKWFADQTSNDNPYVFRTEHYPLLPLYQNFQSTPDNTLNNAVTVTLNGKKIPVVDLNANEGYVKLNIQPKVKYAPDGITTIGDVVLATYYYQKENVISDRIAVEYDVSEANCAKAKGNSDLADYTISPVGNYNIVERELKLIQDLKKIVVTLLGSDKVATWYGTNFTAMIGQKAFLDYTKTRISSEIVNAMTNLKNAQIKQEEYQEVTDNEFLNFISGISVTISDVDSTYYSVDVAVVTQAGTSFTITQPLNKQQLQLNSLQSNVKMGA